MFVVELTVAAAVPFNLQREDSARPAQLVAPAHRQANAVAPPLIVGDRSVRLLGGPASDRLLSRLASNIGAAIDQVEAFWGRDWSRDIFDSVDPTHRVAFGQRIVFAPGAVNMSDSALRIVLTHELFHYAARVETALDAPHWLTEGVADFVARPATTVAIHPAPSALTREIRPLSIALTLPSDIELDTPGPQRSLAYDRAWWFARFVADSYGAAKLRAFYLAACGVGHTDVLTAVHDVLGTDYAGVLSQWKQWMLR